MQEYKRIIETKEFYGGALKVTQVTNVFPTKYEDYYVSMDGNVYRYKDNKIKRLRPRERGGAHNDRYLSVIINDNGKIIDEYVHRLAATVFCPNFDPLTHTQVNHIDGNRKNNNINNLEWVTPQQNTEHKINRWKYSYMTPLFDLQAV